MYTVFMYKTFFSLLLIPVFLVPGTLYSAHLFFESSSTQVGVNQVFKVTVFLDSEDEVINAMEGIISIPDHLSITAINDSKSILSLWAEPPEVVDDNIVFGGIKPGGWFGNRGELFSFQVTSDIPGAGKFITTDATLFLHDEATTLAQLTSGEWLVEVDSNIPLFPSEFIFEDDTPPEPFPLFLVQDRNVFDADYALVFNATDEGSGIAFYEVQETIDLLEDDSLGEWQRAESPYRIVDQSLQGYVYVRATDRAGNSTTEIFVAPLFDVKITPAGEVARIIFMTIAVLVGLVIGLVIAFGWRRSLAFCKRSFRGK